jgi:HK97 family phage major capsid protein
MSEVKTIEQLAGEVKADFETKFNNLKGIAEDAVGKAAAGETLSAAAKQTADEAIVAVTEAKSRLDDLEQKMDRKGGEDRPVYAKSPGYQFIESDEFKAFQGLKGSDQAGKRISIETKAIISSLSTDADGSVGDLVVPQRLGMLDPVERRLTIRDLLAPGRTNSGSIQYPQETGFTNSAATHTETAGTTKPQSEMKIDLVTANVTTIAHWVLATRQILDDAPMLQSYIDRRLRYGLKLKEEAQLLNGGGTGTDLNGVYTQATALGANPAVVSMPTQLDVLRVAMLQAFLAEFPPNGSVLNPIDWAKIEMLKDTAGAYIIGDPQKSGVKTVWGIPVVETQAMTVDKFLVGAFGMAAQIFDREDANVAVSTEDSDNFRKNLVTILAEERLALAVYRPEAFVKGDFSDAITDLTS